ncbi:MULTISPECIES: sensor histidine kinase [Streptomyces]|uniref:sensor histidine kinase n=1 Tax=Streptomyces TaxID=1883 RepID=UPI000F792263|nr:sensor histidine kinase [Streptomyces sp. WAC07149]GLX17717.1 two-component sensor histidine kinase [Streptomyces lavendulae subsp. lavendulae]GLX26059.1 two-component sensor histidine kinase [Streptomyces lavendulae subsp. lavendulae]
MALTQEADGLHRIGQAPETTTHKVVKSLWIGIWLFYLSAPVTDLVSGGHSTGARLLGGLGLLAFTCWYLVLVFRTVKMMPVPRVLVSLAVLATQATVLSLTLGREWLVLFVYVSISSGAALPGEVSRWTVPGATALLTAVALAVPGGTQYLAGLVVPALMGGFAMVGVRAMIRTTIELRQARATVAELAANEERLRMARDLHDLLGHSLSLITLKSELAGRMLPEHPERAAQQVADIERVSRQALVDVREAVSGYRRPTLPGELAGARTALAAAGVAADLPAGCDDAELPEETESALAWSLREAVTNVVRHSGARRCTVTLTTRQTLAGPVVELTVTDDGTGGPAVPGNGLTGLTERLEAVGGSLSAGPVGKTGFRLLARVPLGSGS